MSVIMPAYNRAGLIAHSLHTVVKQRYRPLEIVVVDDGSTDDTREIVRRFGRWVRYVHQQHAGVSAARNNGIRAAAGEWIAFLDSDDLWLDGMVDTGVAHLKANPDCDIVQGRTEILHGVGPASPSSASAEPYRPFLGSMIFRRALFDRVGGFDERLGFSEDIDWLARAQELGIKPERLDHSFLRYRVHADNMTHDVRATRSLLVAVVKRARDRRKLEGER